MWADNPSHHQPRGLVFFVPSWQLISSLSEPEAPEQLDPLQHLARHLLTGPTTERLLQRARARLEEALQLEAEHSSDAADAWHMAELLWQQVQSSSEILMLLRSVAAGLDVTEDQAEVHVQQVLAVSGTELFPVLNMRAFLQHSQAPKVLRDWHVKRIASWIPGLATRSEVMELYAACLLAMAQRSLAPEKRIGWNVIRWLAGRAQDDRLAALVVRCYAQALARSVEIIEPSPPFLPAIHGGILAGVDVSGAVSAVAVVKPSLRVIQERLTLVEELEPAGPPCLALIALRASLHCDLASANSRRWLLGDRELTWHHLARALALYQGHGIVEYELDAVRPRIPRGPAGIDGFFDTPEGRRLVAWSQMAHAREVAYRLGLDESSAEDLTLTEVLLQATAKAQTNALPIADGESFASRVEWLAMDKTSAAASLPWPRIHAALKHGPLQRWESLATRLPEPPPAVPQVAADPTRPGSNHRSRSLLLRALDRERGFTLVPGGLERVMISRCFRYGLRWVFYEGSLLGTCDRKELEESKSFVLPDGGKFLVQLVKRWWTGGRGDLHVLYNGLQLPQSDRHPQAYKRQALRGLTAALVFVSLVGLLTKLHVSFVGSLGLGYAALILASVLGFFYLRSQIWGWLALLPLLASWNEDVMIEVFAAPVVGVVDKLRMLLFVDRRKERRLRADYDTSSASAKEQVPSEQRIPFDPEGEQALVSWGRRLRHFRGTCDDTLVCEAFAPEAKEQFTRGVSFSLRDGSELLVQRTRNILFTKLLVLHDGIPVLGSQSHPPAVIRLAAASLSCLAVIKMILAHSAIASGPSGPSSAGSMSAPPRFPRWLRCAASQRTAAHPNGCRLVTATSSLRPAKKMKRPARSRCLTAHVPCIMVH